jgi:prolyl-tRNA editing enzyme YbaK/EbsC (Cys-tRNA(Pro) deacylase)
MPIVMQSSIAELPYLHVNGGRRGLLVSMKPEDLSRVLKPALADIAAHKGG